MISDPYILLSYINTKLRDYYMTLEDLSEKEDIDLEEISQRLNSINYYYDKEKNQFIRR